MELTVQAHKSIYGRLACLSGVCPLFFHHHERNFSFSAAGSCGLNWLQGKAHDPVLVNGLIPHTLATVQQQHMPKSACHSGTFDKNLGENNPFVQGFLTLKMMPAWTFWEPSIERTSRRVKAIHSQQIENQISSDLILAPRSKHNWSYCPWIVQIREQIYLFWLKSFWTGLLSLSIKNHDKCSIQFKSIIFHGRKWSPERDKKMLNTAQ